MSLLSFLGLGNDEASYKELFDRKKQNLKELDDYRRERASEVRHSAESFYSGEAEKKSTLARLDAEIEFKKEKLELLEKTTIENKELHKLVSDGMNKWEARNEVVLSQKETIKLLQETIQLLAGKLPKVELDKLNVNVSTKVESEKK